MRLVDSLAFEYRSHPGRKYGAEPVASPVAWAALLHLHAEEAPMSLFDPILPVGHVAAFLDANHYLGRATRGFAWSDEFGVVVLANPTARFLPQQRWLEVIRWCLVGIPNGGSQQWRRVVGWLKENRAEVTTIVSYSDPSQGHTGALYKACNWRWAPTWHRLFPPPTGNGSWPSGPQAVKDRWVYPLRADVEREEILRVKDSRASATLAAVA